MPHRSGKRERVALGLALALGASGALAIGLALALPGHGAAAVGLAFALGQP
jgi:hypothetical protein